MVIGICEKVGITVYDPFEERIALNFFNDEFLPKFYPIVASPIYGINGRRAMDDRYSGKSGGI